MATCSLRSDRVGQTARRTRCRAVLLRALLHPAQAHGWLRIVPLAGNTQAYEMVQKMAQWVHDRVEAVLEDPNGGMVLWQKVLLTEWGGMNDVLFNLYEHTGNEMHLKTARYFLLSSSLAPLLD